MRNVLSPWLIFLIGLFISSAPLRAEDTDVVIINWIDNVTFGLPSTLFGLGEIGIEKIRGKKTKIRLSEDGKQIVVEGVSLLNEGPHAIGLLHITPEREIVEEVLWKDGIPVYDFSIIDRHEAGHSLQFGTLGVFFTPVSIAQNFYSKNHHHTPLEDWASAWGDLGKTMVKRKKFSLRFGISKTNDGDRGEHFGASLVLAEKLSRVDADGAKLSDLAETAANKSTGYDGRPQKAGSGKFPVQVAYRYGKLGVNVSNTAGCQGTNQSLNLEAGLFEKDFLAEWSLVNNALRWIIDSHQEMGSFEINIENRTVDAELINHKVGNGIRIGDRKRIAAEIIGRLSYGMKGKWGPGDPGLIFGLGTGYEGKIHLLDALQVYYRQDNEYGTNNYRLKSKTLGISTPKDFDSRTFTGKTGDKGNPQKLEGSIEFSEETEAYQSQGQNQNKHIKMTMFNLDGRW